MSETVIAALSRLSIEPSTGDLVHHDAAESQAGWNDALSSSAASNVPSEYRLLKTLVWKPKTAKSETPLPLMVVTDDKTQTSTSAIAAETKLKELRLAVPELLKSTLDATKDDGRFVVLIQYLR